MKNKVTLYISTHNKTGLKYFGKTEKYFTQEELQKYYHGSGKYWLSHLKKHGNDVTMEVYGIYNLNEVEEVALKFSEDNDIVKALNESGDRKGKKIWANMKPENGLTGNVKGNKHSKETIANMGMKKEKHPFYNKHRSEETKRKISASNKGKNKGKVLAVVKGVSVLLSKEEFDNNNFSTHTTNKVTGFNRITKEKIFISKEEFDANDDYVGVNYNMKITDEFRRKMSFVTTGSKNPRALNIKIYNENGIEQYNFIGEFDKGCKDNNLPVSQLAKSYRNNGKPITSKGYEGWFAKKII